MMMLVVLGPAALALQTERGGDMNPVFYLIVIIAAILLWTLLAFIFYPLGRFMWRLISDTAHELNRDDEQKESEEEE